MNLHIAETKTQVILGWVTMTILAGVASGTHSLTTWTMLLAAALTPSLVVLHFWSRPTKSTSESIREALR